MTTLTQAAAQPIGLSLRTHKAAVYDSLSGMISELELAPGARLVESELAARFDVSKTPIREALLLLDGDGLVQLQPYHGATVTWLSVEEYAELLFVQDALEHAAIPLVVAGITRDEVEFVGGLLDRLEERRRDADSYGFFQIGAQIHERLFSIAHSPHLLRAVMSLILRPTRRYERAFMHQFDATWDEELDIMRGRFERIRAGDPDGAVQHVREGRLAMMALIIERLDDPLVARYLAPQGANRKRPRRRRAAPSTGEGAVSPAGD